MVRVRFRVRIRVRDRVRFRIRVKVRVRVRVGPVDRIIPETRWRFLPDCQKPQRPFDKGG